MKYNKIFIFLATVFLLGMHVNAAEVTNVELSHKNGETVAAVDINGTIRYTHQTVEAKDGKPFRVIVDILSATHEIGAKNFMALPNCSISKLRTSQYSVTPEKVVRLVFDMKKETVYSIDSDSKQVRVTIPGNSYKSFSNWTTKTVVVALKQELKQKKQLKKTPKVIVKKEVLSKSSKTVAQLNKSIESDRQSSLQSSKVAVTKPKSKPVVTVAKKETKWSNSAFALNFSEQREVKPVAKEVKPVQVIKKSGKSSKAKVDNTDKNKVKIGPAPKPKLKTKPVFAEKKKFQTKSVAVKSKPEKKKAVIAKAAPKKQTTKAVAKVSPKKQTTKAVAKVSPKKQTTKAVAKAAPKKKPTKKVLAKKEVNKSKTSRFRRSPVASNKIKGTMVAEFPKRLVIKYKSRNRRDPFETLINETKVNNTIVERRKPNVEGLKLVGVIESTGGNNRALLEDKTGYGYILKSGDKVKKGYVLRVENERVYFQIFEYGWSRTVALKLEND